MNETIKGYPEEEKVIAYVECPNCKHLITVRQKHRIEIVKEEFEEYKRLKALEIEKETETRKIREAILEKPKTPLHKKIAEYRTWLCEHQTLNERYKYEIDALNFVLRILKETS